MIHRAVATLVAMGGQWGSHWVRSHAERRHLDGEAWAAVEVGNGLADRWADNPTGQLRKSCDNNPITPVRWWTAIPATPMEELEDTLSRNVLRISTESDTAAYLWGRQKPTDTISDWRECIRWDWRIFKGWMERQTHPSRKLSNRATTAQAASSIDDFLFRITGQRPVGGLVVFRSKLWWGFLLDDGE